VQRRASRALSELDVAYPDSPLVDQHRTPLWTAHLAPDPSSESPALLDWLAFGDGPTPGARVPDLHFPLPDGTHPRLHPLLRGGHHTLLLFDGAAATEAGYQNLTRIAESAARRLADRLHVHIIVPARERPRALPSALSVILDAKGALHRAFSARSECLYLIRPDGHVAFRSQPASEQVLAAYLDRHFV
jgi:hypothetical protein